MALTMSEERYQEIRRKVMERRRQDDDAIAAEVEKIRSEPGKMTFQTVDALFEHLDSVTKEEPSPKRSGRKRR